MSEDLTGAAPFHAATAGCQTDSSLVTLKQLGSGSGELLNAEFDSR